MPLPPNVRRNAIGIVQAAVAVGAMTYIAAVYDLRAIAAKAGQVGGGIVSICLAISALQIVLLVIRWKLLIETLPQRAALKSLLLGTLSERFVNQLLPSTLAGDATRVLELIRAGFGRWEAFESVFLDRGFGILGLVILACVALPFVPGDALRSELGLALLTLAAGSGVGVLVLVGISEARWRSAFRHPGLTRLLLLVMAVRRILMQPHRLVAVVGLSIGVQLLFCVIYALLGAAIAPDLSWMLIGLTVPILMLASLLPLSIGGWGVREGATLLLLGSLGASAETALAISITFGLLQLVVGIACGVIWLWLSLVWARTLPGEAGQARVR